MGGVAIDQSRGFSGTLALSLDGGTGAALAAADWFEYGNAVFYPGTTSTTMARVSSSAIQAVTGKRQEYNLARNQPVGVVIRPRSLGVLACSYMGVPAL